jgi:hypothetical protein
MLRAPHPQKPGPASPRLHDRASVTLILRHARASDWRHQTPRRSFSGASLRLNQKEAPVQVPGGGLGFDLCRGAGGADPLALCTGTLNGSSVLLTPFRADISVGAATFTQSWDVCFVISVFARLYYVVMVSLFRVPVMLGFFIMVIQMLLQCFLSHWLSSPHVHGT